MDAARQPGAPLPERIVRAAIQWRLKLDVAADQARVQALIQHWCQQHPEHALAWQRLGGLQRELDAYTATLPSPELGIPILKRAGTDLQRRRALKLLTLTVAVGGPAGWLVTSIPSVTADYRVATGERRQITLADGSELLLNSGSALDVLFSATERLLVLRAGELQVSSAADPNSLRASPLRVACRHGWCDSADAQFVLRDQGSHSDLLVQQGSVAVSTLGGQQPLAVKAGERYALYPEHIEPIGHQTIDPSAWTRGMLVVDDIRLDAFLQELGRYRSGLIGCDPAVADLRLSGVFQLDQQAALLEHLARTLPVDIVSRSRFWVRLVAKA
ncbi:ferric-dicitrate binding protein FerR, regulates iron transport through sigma-19 [Halopseudomonas sabulinigri]|uniref:Ferric-dicitrate binding protein FerR, regulates iron transport through sigma-19 n=1 Tax=Halopseudomonas sabulinigri TaxID=472181 RepID=A0A1H1LQK8_9GAMM|nr:FecR domain-containing protein [Halopseudomonas sabulinigri]SDR76831.1 ferric-dicitrate binding protein FerR, regulates iron transport through sigma-19 [Halopseudomonas sabulinigri]